MKQIQDMTLREKIGQMLLCGFEGTEATDKLKELIAEHQVGGVIYFAWPEFRHSLPEPAGSKNG